MKRYLSLLFLLPMFLSSAHAQHYTRDALRLGLISGVNLGGEEATIKYAAYTPHPYGMFTIEYFAWDRLALAGSLYAGTLAAELRGRFQFPEWPEERISSYDTKYYGLSVGADYAFPAIWELTPIAKARVGGMMHHTRVNGEGGFDNRISQGALIWGIGGGVEYPVSRVLNLTFSYDLVLTNSDKIDGLRSGERNDALSLLTLGINVLIKPGDVPPPRSRVYSSRSARITPERNQRDRTPAPRDDMEAPGDDTEASRDDSSVPDRHGTSPVGGTGGPIADDRRREDVPPEETGLALQTAAPPPAAEMREADDDAPLQLFTQLSIVPIRRLSDLEERPELFTLNAWQTGDERMILKSYVEMLRDGRVIYEGNADLLLDDPSDAYTANEFMDLETLLNRNEGDAPLPRGNYVLRVSTVAWEQELSSLSQAKFLNVDLRPIFGRRADTARQVIVKRAVDVMAEGDRDLLVNFFAAGKDAAGREIPERQRAERLRDPLPLAPIGVVGVTRERRLADEVQKAFTEALQLQNIAGSEGRSEDLKIIVSELYFPIDEELLSEESRVLLDNVARQITQHPEVFAEIRGYANDVGDRTANRALARRRAERVLEYLVRQKISSYRLSIGEVETEALMTEPNRDPRLGRKVEIILTHRGM